MDLALFLAFYIVAYAIGFLAGHYINGLFLSLFVFDVMATFIIWIGSLILKNSSLYDAYWSLTPMAMIIYLLIVCRPIGVYGYVFAAALLIWSGRLTFNWITTFENRKWEDWRYKKYRAENSPLVWHIINFFGIQMMPTLLVYVAFAPAIMILSHGVGAYSLFGVAIILIGTTLETLADHQMHSFLKEGTKGKVCQKGLWNYSRHPNYLGEISVWVGTFVSFIPYYYYYWYFIIGTFLMICLFCFISIPMMEKRQKSRRPDYESYIASTSMLLLLPKRK